MKVDWEGRLEGGCGELEEVGREREVGEAEEEEVGGGGGLERVEAGGLERKEEKKGEVE